MDLENPGKPRIQPGITWKYPEIPGNTCKTWPLKDAGATWKPKIPTPAMLYPMTDFGKHYPMTKLDFTTFFQRHHPTIESFQQIIEGKLVGCAGSKFIRSESGLIEATLFGRETKVDIVSWKTKNFKDEDRVCAIAVFELREDYTWYLWSIFFSTCDPFFLDNFTHPLGTDFSEKRATPSSESPTRKLITHPTHPCIEQLVFLERKAKDHMAENAKCLANDPEYRDVLRCRAASSTFITTSGLREILGVHAHGVPTAEDRRKLMGSCTSEEFAAIEKEEKKALREVVMSLSPTEFYTIYDAWLQHLFELPRNLTPSEYKKRARWILLSEEGVRRWDRSIFLYMLSGRANLVMDSPYDAALWLGCSARTFSEVSHDDARFAEKTPADNLKLGEMMIEENREWIIRSVETVVYKQGAYLAVLKAACEAGDIEGALLHLTEGTAEPRFGQGLLGLSEALLRDLTAERIIFPLQLMTAIRLHLDNDWSLPLLAVNATADPAEPTYQRFLWVGESAKGG